MSACVGFHIKDYLLSLLRSTYLLTFLETTQHRDKDEEEGCMVCRFCVLCQEDKQVDMRQCLGLGCMLRLDA
jgi:hypothetical protein